jgi:benzodiazapine receptor
MATIAPQPHRGRPTVLALAGFLLLCGAVAAVAAVVTQSAVHSWYPGLAKPAFTPPNWAFPVAWTVLYILMAVAAWRVWRRNEADDRGALTLWFAQLALNFAWSILFFGLHQVTAGLIDIAVLLLLILATAAAFWTRDRPAALMMLPYAAWVGFAAALNGAIWRLN